VTHERSTLFRKEALRRASGGDEGDVLRLSSRFTRSSYWLLVAAFALGSLYCIFGTVHEYASGPAVVWIEGKVRVTANLAGTVSGIEVRPGQRVERGQIIARFHAATETAELLRLQREFDLQLLKTLRDPSDRAAREALTSLRTQKDLAAARLDELTVKATDAGVIGDVRIHPGQRLSAGDIVVTIDSDEHVCSIVAMLPAQYRPQLHAGMSMRFEATGYRYAYQEMTIDSVGAEIIGPTEVKRYLGHEIDDTIAVAGPVVLVEATLPSSSFDVDGRSFELFHGMNGTAEARVRSESILVALIPGLRVLTEKLP
jgi:membrane fusion protein (multidrug efflux system)